MIYYSLGNDSGRIWTDHKYIKVRNRNKETVIVRLYKEKWRANLDQIYNAAAVMALSETINLDDYDENFLNSLGGGLTDENCKFRIAQKLMIELWSESDPHPYFAVKINGETYYAATSCNPVCTQFIPEPPVFNFISKSGKKCYVFAHRFNKFTNYVTSEVVISKQHFFLLGNNISINLFDKYMFAYGGTLECAGGPGSDGSSSSAGAGGFGFCVTMYNFDANNFITPAGNVAAYGGGGGAKTGTYTVKESVYNSTYYVEYGAVSRGGGAKKTTVDLLNIRPIIFRYTKASGQSGANSSWGKGGSAGDGTPGVQGRPQIENTYIHQSYIAGHGGSAGNYYGEAYLKLTYIE